MYIPYTYGRVIVGSQLRLDLHFLRVRVRAIVMVRVTVTVESRVR